MGEARRRKKKTAEFLESHPYCCFCGGSVEAVTTEHAPPKVFFIDKIRPYHSHEFPACKRCNHGSSGSDQIAAFFSLLMADFKKKVPEGYLAKLRSGIRNNQPEVFSALRGNGKGWLLKETGLRIPFAELEVPKIVFKNWLNPWAAKQGYALWYEYTGEILPSSAIVQIRWFSNLDLNAGKFPPELLEALPSAGCLTQGSQHSIEQYCYKHYIAKNRGAGLFALYLYRCCIVCINIGIDGPGFANGLKWVRFSTDSERGIHSLGPVGGA